MCDRSRTFLSEQYLSIAAEGHGMFRLAGTSLSTREHTMWRVEFDGGH
jgi:hypothetical protein